ncbi:sucrose-specific PTS transporter subunit IIBC [Lactiplantibacillus plantarum]|uniref:sucrose-specific PTS transporter subunit IIBC n=1 Tax=Lactiplantibacillus plantarum TaxID=1590 RepID=UPI001E3C6F8A|nr:sucrose-specific PTS transporter subunit IIBC [Lactiplantibacillus plantarum]MCC9315224.1 ROK family protein [Lactiplantibacillus plantarum]MEE4615957.1 sucrose-specific PTS transporter subunit IIBC [Lactiplantibacillus plantarum]
MNHQEVADRVLNAIGKNNIQAAAHCATRLRLVIKDESKIDQQALDDDADVKGTFETNGQYQIIIGPGDVDKVYDALIAKTGLKEATPDDIKAVAAAGQKKNPLMDFLKVLSDIFIPIVPALVAGGLLMALNNVLTAEHLFMAKSVVEVYPGLKSIAEMINAMASAPFTFLPILLGFSATKRFGGNPYLGATMGMIMVLPSLVNGYSVATTMAAGKMIYWNVFGLHVAQAGYQGQVLPVLAVAYILATLEKFFHKHIKGAFDFTFTPMFAIVITGFLTFTIVGPVLRTVSDALTNGLVGLYNTTGWIGMGIFGLLYSAIVITGLHQTFPAIETQLLANVAKTGGSFIFPVASMANIGQGAATLAIFFATKSQKQKALTSSAGVSALLGITEPAIFGVNLKMKFPFVFAAIASGIASAFLGLFHVLSVAMGPASVIGFISIASKSIPAFMLSAVISFVVAFIPTFIYAKRTLGDDRDQVKSPAPTSTGVGAGVISQNHIFNGRTHTELGHMRLNRLPGDDFKSNCPYHDICLEGLAAGPAVGKRTGKAGKDIPVDDPVWPIIADYIAQACVNLTVAFAPDKIILNGGVMNQRQLFPMIREKFAAYLNGYEEVPPLDDYIVPAGLGNNSGIAGGLLLAQAALKKA